jgi:rubrerythrin
MVSAELRELLLQALEHERGGVLVYGTALECARHPELRDEWERYRAETEEHVQVLTRACVALGLDPGEMTPSRKIVQHTGKLLVVAMKMALGAGDPAAAELVACDCVVLAETRDHANWELIGQCAKALDGEVAATLRQAYEQVEDEEDEHLYHTRGWTRELWLEALGVPAVLPPPEEEKHVKTAIGAARAQQQREEML